MWVPLDFTYWEEDIDKQMNFFSAIELCIMNEHRGRIQATNFS